jgi:internalin A
MAKETSDKGKTAFAEAEARIQEARAIGAYEIDLSHLGLTELPEALATLTQLQTLWLFRNRLRSVPEWLGQLTRLQTLWLDDNRITSISPSFGQLTQLQTLLLSRNRLTSIPEPVGQLIQLRTLSLSHNQLTSVPEWLGHLSQLRELHLDNNQLIALPQSLRGLTGLESLHLHGNDALGLPTEVLGPTWPSAAKPHGERASPFDWGLKGVVARKAMSAFHWGLESVAARKAKPADILDYYFRVLAGKRPLNEAKLILVGRGGVGKTSLVNRLLCDRFDPDETKTEGICISGWKLRLHGKEEVRLNLWDFGGQEIMHATHQFFLTQRSLYLLVLEGRQGAEDADAEYWLKLIESFGTESSGEVSPVLIVLNKIKANPFDLNRRALQQKYPFIRGFVATDCKDRTGMKELRAAIEHETDQLKHLRDSFPASWFAVKDCLAGTKKNFMTFDEYRKLCNKQGERKAAGQDSLAYYLHSLGIALNFKDDPRLRDTHVLNPHWVTNGIYRLVNSPLLAKQKGEIELADAAEILDARKYPARMHRFLLDLMKKFELCFTFPDDDAHYLIPELLDKQEAVEAAQFKPGECLNFEYRYPVLPEGLLPRFIVRTHALSSNLPRWRTGVVLAFEGNRALVKADVQDKRVFIAVSGPVAGRRRLLAVIRSDFERIHADISKLRAEGWVPLPGHPGESVLYEDLLVMEREGERRFKKPIKGRLVEIDVQGLLNGVDLEGTRRREEIQMAQAVRLFYSYSHKDEMLRNELETHLKLLQRTGLISVWHDRNIEAGDDWKKQIDENLERADIILLLVSADFIASDYCYEKEMKRALDRHETGEARVIPVIVRDVNWGLAPFAKLQALPKDAKAVMEWPSKDAAWRGVSEGIERIVRQMRADGRGGHMG